MPAALPPTAPVDVEPDLDVSIVMPCLNETRTLPNCIDWAQQALATMAERWGLTGEVVIADNGSTDGSQALSNELGARVVDCPVKGYGAALRYGIRAARGRMIIMGDADSSYDFREGVAMVEKLREGYALCMGSRLRGKIMPGAMPWKNQHIGNPALTGILNLFFRSGLSDAHSGLRAFTKEAFLDIAPTSDGMEFASELVIKATLLNHKRTEVPITLHPDGRDRPPHLRPLQDGWRHLRYLMMLSPAWLFLAPGLLMLTLGASVLGLLSSVPAGETARVGAFWIGDHWMFLAMGMLSIGQLSILFAMAATLVGIRHGYRKPTRLLRTLYWISKLEHLLVLSLVLLAAGGVTFANVVAEWVARDFGPLQMQRPMMWATCLFVLGGQTFFGAFLLSIVAGNEADLDAVIEQARNAPRPSLPPRAPD